MFDRLAGSVACCGRGRGCANPVPVSSDDCPLSVAACFSRVGESVRSTTSGDAEFFSVGGLPTVGTPSQGELKSGIVADTSLGSNAGGCKSVGAGGG